MEAATKATTTETYEKKVEQQEVFQWTVVDTLTAKQHCIILNDHCAFRQQLLLLQSGHKYFNQNKQGKSTWRF